LQDELTALAGPSAGPNAGQIYIDGFYRWDSFSKSSIREISPESESFFGRIDNWVTVELKSLPSPAR